MQYKDWTIVSGGANGRPQFTAFAHCKTEYCNRHHGVGFLITDTMKEATDKIDAIELTFTCP